MTRITSSVRRAAESALPFAKIALMIGACLSPLGGAYAQDPSTSAFEVASIKLLSGQSNPLQDHLWENFSAARGGLHFFPGSGQRVELHGINGAQLVAAAYRVASREIVGPSWIIDAKFEIDALIPSGQTRDKAPEMLLTLLHERLALEAHREVRRASGYILSVSKDGPKLKEAAPAEPNTTLSRPDRTKSPYNGFKRQMTHCDMIHLADNLAHDLGLPVEDRTGLKGFYDILIQIPASDMKDESDRLGAFRNALGAYGLHLDGGKIDVPVIVIENLSKTPTAN